MENEYLDSYERAKRADTPGTSIWNKGTGQSRK